MISFPVLAECFPPRRLQVPFLNHYFLPTDKIYRTVDREGQSPLSHNGLVILFPR